ncbi:hypothetical protein [uncultured Winogradskyella sp.]|uniref:hypothetical protein n=1 Tax=uncultured Winogradskyella sp. TaxID=395353 RepID=UPI00262954FE|nr:hypothetical protein [uncultured Winogradskyella sp.]
MKIQNVMKIRNSKLIATLVIMVSFLATSCSDDDSNNNGDDGTISLFASNNSDGNITVYDVTSSQSITSKTLITTSTAADGVYYNSNTESVFQASRSGNNLEGFMNVDDLVSGSVINVGVTGTSDMMSPREVAVNGNLFVVADNADVDGDTNTPDGRLYVYTMSNGSFSLRNVITTNFKLWGITFNGNDLYAVVDATNELAIFTNFLSNTSTTTLSASKRIVIEGIVRTHGITYDAGSDVLVMSDIALASNGQDDGGFHVIENFTNKLNATSNGATLALSSQTRVAGSSTLLGNPVDVAYDADSQTVYIAEAGNGGGRILAFNNIGSGGNLAPFFNSALASASSVYLSNN